MGPHEVACGADGTLQLHNQDQTLLWSVLPIIIEGPLDARAVLEPMAKNIEAEATNNPKAAFKGSRFETSPGGHEILILFLGAPDERTGKEVDLVSFWTLRQRSTGETFAQQFVVQIKEGMTPEEALPQMLVGFLPLLDLFQVAEL
jgi:hypothetical protein